MVSRIRTVKPDFFSHEKLYDLESKSGLPVRLCFIGLWTQCDREGRFKWRPRALKTRIAPYDDIDLGAVLDALAEGGFVERYEAGGEAFGWVPSFLDHQHVNHREAKSAIPSPRVGDASGTRASRVGDAARGEGNGTEGKGTEPNPREARVEALDISQNGNGRHWGSSAEWDRSTELMGRMKFDAAAVARVQDSPVDDMALVRLLADAESDRRVKKKAGWVLKALGRMESEL